MSQGFNASFPNELWGVPVAASVALSNSQCLVLDAQQCLVLDREQAQLSFGYVDDGFVRNQAVVLCELRAQLAVFDSRAVQVVTIPADSPG